MRQHPIHACPDDETLAAWVEGRLPEAERMQLIEHAGNCDRCILLIDAANEAYRDESGGSVAAMPMRRELRQQWLLAAAAVIVLAVPAAFFFQLRRQDPLRKLVAVAPASAREIEPRLAGGFAWAPYRGAMRANAGAPSTEQMKMMGAAAEVLEEAQRDASPETQHAAALAMVLTGRAEDAIAALATQAKRSPADAKTWSDLAAARYAAAAGGRTSSYPDALAAADRALAIEPRLPEALFNRALTLERMGLREQARAAWQRYLDVDPSSSWAAEARAHLARLDASGTKPAFDREQIEKIAATGDEHALRPLVQQDSRSARAWAETEYLGRWGEALLRNDAAEASRWLTTARTIGLALANTSGESLLRDAVQAIDAASHARRQQIAQAHVTYRRGRRTYSRRDYHAAEADLRVAAEQFAAAADPMALVARTYVADARLAQNDVAAALRELTALLPDIDAARGYLAIAGQARSQLGRALMFDGDWSGSARVLAEAESLFGRAGERDNQALAGTMLADALTVIGRPDEAWATQVRVFDTLSAVASAERLDAAISASAMIERRAGHRERARALVGLAEAVERQLPNELLLADTLVSKALLDAPIDAAAALRSAREAESIALRVPDAALRARHLADANVAMAVALEGSDAWRARELVSNAIELYAGSGMTGLVADPYLVRARISLRLGDVASAERDLDAGIAAVEQHPAFVAGNARGIDALDAGNALFEEAIRLDAVRGDAAAALEHAERMRGARATATTLGELRARLAGSNTAVLELVVLPEKVVSIAVTERGGTIARHAIARDDLRSLASHGDEAALYDVLIRPAAAAIADARALIVVPDVLLEKIPFAALRDGEHALVERMLVALAPSAAALQVREASVPAVLSVVGLPSGPATGLAPLPEVEVETSRIGRLYRTVRRDGADVLHIAGHTSDEPSGDAALAGGVTWRAIAAMDDVPPLVVLSACNTLGRSPEPGRRALSLGGAFIAAGAHDVVGTLSPVADVDASDFFFALHEQLTRGIAAPAALRNVQLEQQRRPGGAWKSMALLTTTIRRAD